MDLRDLPIGNCMEKRLNKWDRGIGEQRKETCH